MTNTRSRRYLPKVERLYLIYADGETAELIRETIKIPHCKGTEASRPDLLSLDPIGDW